MPLRVRAVLVASAVAFAAIGRSLAAQTPTPTQPRFEVASVKPDPSPKMPGFRVLPGGRLIGSFTVKELVQIAFRTPDHRYAQIIIGPAWVTTSHFAINATVGPSGSPTVPVLAPLIRSLLEDRFKLVVHTETRDTLIYALVVARSDTRLGPQMHPIQSAECDVRKQQQSPAPDALPCGALQNRGTAFSTFGVPMSSIAGDLTAHADRIVRDRTGVDGIFDAELHWDDSLSIFTAVQEQLGLKLEPSHESMDVLVIDHVEQPTPD